MTAAINLALEGYRPIIYELRADVGMRFAGDFQYFENWTNGEDAIAFLRRMNIRLDFPIEPISGATAFDARHRGYEFHTDRPAGYMVRRGCCEDSLDMALKRQALDVGVRFEFGRKAEIKEVDIVATGPDSRRSYILVQGLVFKTDLENTVCILFDQRVAPKVYAYFVAHRGHGVVCACFTREERDRARRNEYLNKAVESFQAVVPFEMKESRLFGNYGITPLIEEFDRPVVGEAAGFQDANWGFGMRLAILSGYLAARAVIEGKDYWSMAQQEVIPWVKSAWVNRRLFEAGGDLAARVLLSAMAMCRAPRWGLSLLYRPYALKLLLYKAINQ
jgi:flavin-dependent dehydrogenase